MKLWLLKPINDDDWPAYDACYGFVVRAETARKARKMVAPQGADEGKDVWLDNTRTSCTMLGDSKGARPGIVLSDFRAG